MPRLPPLWVGSPWNLQSIKKLYCVQPLNATSLAETNAGFLGTIQSPWRLQIVSFFIDKWKPIHHLFVVKMLTSSIPSSILQPNFAMKVHGFPIKSMKASDLTHSICIPILRDQGHFALVIWQKHCYWIILWAAVISFYIHTFNIVRVLQWFWHRMEVTLSQAFLDLIFPTTAQSGHNNFSRSRISIGYQDKSAIWGLIQFIWNMVLQR